MRTLSVLSLMFGLSLTACGPEPERWGGDNLTTPDQGNVDSDSNSGHDTNGNSGGGNSGGNTTTECHAYDPFQKVGSVRNYAVTSRGDSGTEVQTVLSQGLTPDGRPANRVEVKTEANDQEQTGFFYHACASDGAALKIGANVENTITFDMGLTVFTESLGWIEDMYQPGQRYLPPVADMGSPGQRWSGSYTVHTTVQDSPTSFEVEGQFEELPRGTTTVPAGTFETYQIIYRFEEERGSSDPFGLGDFGFDFGFDMFGFFGNAGEDIDAISELHFAEGIGLVYELTVDAGSGQVIMERSLTSYSIAN